MPSHRGRRATDRVYQQNANQDRKEMVDDREGGVRDILRVEKRGATLAGRTLHAVHRSQESDIFGQRSRISKDSEVETISTGLRLRRSLYTRRRKRHCRLLIANVREESTRRRSEGKGYNNQCTLTQHSSRDGRVDTEGTKRGTWNDTRNVLGDKCRRHTNVT